MTAERVDKSWSKNGLEKYSTEAILGTLRHYGADVDEGKFKEAAKESFPLMIAMGWHKSWKGVGQFARFPHAAALELWKRFEKDRMLPHEAAEPLAQLLEQAYRRLENKPGADVKGAAAKFIELRGKIPLKGEDPHPGFVDEMMMSLGEEGMKAFDQAGPLLVQQGHFDDAEALVDVEEFLVPERKGIARALLMAERGDKDGAQKILETAAGDTGAGEHRQLRALDALLQLGSYPKVLELGTPLLDRAEKTQDFHFAFDVGRLLMETIERSGGDAKAMSALNDRMQKIADEHDKHHHH